MSSVVLAGLVQAGLWMGSSDSWLPLSEPFPLARSSLQPTKFPCILWRVDAGQETAQSLEIPPLCLPVTPAGTTLHVTVDRNYYKQNNCRLGFDSRK